MLLAPIHASAPILTPPLEGRNPARSSALERERYSWSVGASVQSAVIRRLAHGYAVARVDHGACARL